MNHQPADFNFSSARQAGSTLRNKMGAYAVEGSMHFVVEAFMEGLEDDQDRYKAFIAEFLCYIANEEIGTEMVRALHYMSERERTRLTMLIQTSGIASQVGTATLFLKELGEYK